MVVGPFRPAIRTASVVDRGSVLSDEAAWLEAASLEAAWLDAAVLPAVEPPQAARDSIRAADSSRETNFFMISFLLLPNFLQF